MGLKWKGSNELSTGSETKGKRIFCSYIRLENARHGWVGDSKDNP